MRFIPHGEVEPEGVVARLQLSNGVLISTTPGEFEGNPTAWYAEAAKYDGKVVSVTMRQARRALLAAGLLSSVEAAINALPEPNKTAALIDWNTSNTVERYGSMTTLLGASMGLTGAQIDALFVAASQVPA